MILLKMNKLGIDPDKYLNFEDQSEKFSYVLINPSFDVFLKPGDIVYLLKPGSSNSSANNANIDSLTKLPGQISINSRNLYGIDEEYLEESIDLLESFSLPTSMHSINDNWEESQFLNDMTKKRFSLDNLYRNNIRKKSQYPKKFTNNQVNPDQTILELDELKLIERLTPKNLTSKIKLNGKLKSKLTSINDESKLN